MELRKIHIKNMVCPRCIMVVRQILDELGIGYTQIQLGEVELSKDINGGVREKLAAHLNTVGFALIDDRKSRLIDQIKQLVIDQIYHPQDVAQYKWASLIADALHYDYKYLSSLFSSVEGITLEQYIIKQKIERVKELMIYDELTLSQISFQLKYSSVAHLSAQFKKITGMSPSEFKGSLDQSRKGLNEISG